MAWAILEGLDPDQRRAVIARCVRRKYRKNDTLFHEGDPGNALHLIDKGRVAIRVTTPMGDVATLTVLGPGDVFGEQALLQERSTRTASAVAWGPVETMLLSRADFDALLAEHPGVQRVLVDMLAAQVRRLSDALSEALYLPAEKRVLRRLADLCDLFRPPSANPDDPVTVPVTQDDLATLAGTTRPTANRVLQDAVAAGCVSLGRGRIEVVDPVALVRRSR